MNFVVRSLGGAAALILAIASAGGAQGADRRIPAAGAVKPADGAEAIVTDFYRAWFGAVEQGDPDATIALLAPGFVVKPPLGPPVSDAGAFRSALAALHARVRQSVAWRVEDAEVHGDWAGARISEQARHEPRGGGKARVLTGTHLVILKRIDGRWLLYRDQMSLDALPQEVAR